MCQIYRKQYCEENKIYWLRRQQVYWVFEAVLHNFTRRKANGVVVKVILL
jgi:hypothetical protein